MYVQRLLSELRKCAKRPPDSSPIWSVLSVLFRKLASTAFLFTFFVTGFYGAGQSLDQLFRALLVSDSSSSRVAADHWPDLSAEGLRNREMLDRQRAGVWGLYSGMACLKETERLMMHFRGSWIGA